MVETHIARQRRVSVVRELVERANKIVQDPGRVSLGFRRPPQMSCYDSEDVSAACDRNEDGHKAHAVDAGANIVAALGAISTHLRRQAHAHP